VFAGFNNVAHVKKDDDLAQLRTREDFKELVAGLEGDKSKTSPVAAGK
jgi:hypothetical protein